MWYNGLSLTCISAINESFIKCEHTQLEVYHAHTGHFIPLLFALLLWGLKWKCYAAYMQHVNCSGTLEHESRLWLRLRTLGLVFDSIKLLGGRKGCSVLYEVFKSNVCTRVCVCGYLVAFCMFKGKHWCVYGLCVSNDNSMHFYGSRSSLCRSKFTCLHWSGCFFHSRSLNSVVFKAYKLH